jgi:mono/diheme cytochrome c family protein
MKAALRLLIGCAGIMALGVCRADPPAAAEAPPFTADAGGRQAAFGQTDGRLIYQRICQGCHMADGRGASHGPAAYPPLAANPRFAAKAYPAAVIVNGVAAMPAFGTMLSDEQVAAVVNYLRASFDNHFADSLTPGEVRMLRPATQAPPTELRGR